MGGLEDNVQVGGMRMKGGDREGEGTCKGEYTQGEGEERGAGEIGKVKEGWRPRYR